jgi:ABC-type glycerol-3-phosphate transport system permease component
MKTSNVPNTSIEIAQFERARPRFWSSQKVQDRTIRVIATLLCLAGVVVILLPAAWMISTSLKTQFEALKFPPKWIPVDPQWANYRVALTSNPFGRYFWNTMAYSCSVMVLQALSSSFVAYGFARLRAPGKDLLFILVLATLMLPPQVTLIPQYVMFSKMHWINSYKPLVVPAIFGTSFMIFLLRQFYRGLPKEYEEAALLDGANHLRIWWQIVLPLSKPALGAVAILSFMDHYNDFLGPLLYLNSRSLYTVSLGLQQFQAPFGGTQFHLLMAASVATAIPPILAFFLTQRYFIQGLVIGGIKG